MAGGGHTTVIQRVLERRAQKPSTTEEGTTATVAVMVRVLPPPKALLVFEHGPMRAYMEQRVRPDQLDCESAADQAEALRRFEAEFRPVVLTDNPEVIRMLRARKAQRAPYILYVAELDESVEREAGLTAGADDCIGRRASEREFEARVGAAKRIAELEAVLRITLAENRKLSATDDLTRVASRRFFGKHFPREVDRAARYGRALSLILCDIDHFKKINDTLGHAAGDDILKEFGPRLQRQLRAGIDWVARIGGEEFAIVVPETPYEAALGVARKLRAAVGQVGFKVGNRTLEVTASFGLCGMDRVPAGERGLAERVLKVADAALYRSKNDGRNRVTAAVLKIPAGKKPHPA
ncbi:MAG: GGDEF domain-containing protein [Steroidobacteraceae bacterium]|jgi:two-component system, cell cycle response regulator